METQRFVQQNTATSQSPSVGSQPADTPAGKARSVTTEAGRFEVRIDPPKNRVRAPRSRAEQLTKFVAQFQAETARQTSANVGAELAAQMTPVPKMVNRVATHKVASHKDATSNEIPSREGLPTRDQHKVEEAIQAIDRARRQFSHAAGMSRLPLDQVRSIKTPHPTATRAGIVSTVSEAIASEVSQAQAGPSNAQQSAVAPSATIRQPFFAKPTAAVAKVRPEVVFEPATTSELDETPQNPAPMTNLAVRETEDTEIVELPDSLLREIADQHRHFENGQPAGEASVAAPLAEAAEVADVALDNSVSNSISVDLAAWDVEAFRWSQVSDDILTHAGPVMDQLTHYSLDILTGTENRVAVAGLKRGQGTSTIAASVARWAVAHGKRVLLVDADLGNPQMSRSVGLSPNVSWLNLIREDLIPSEAIIRSKSTGVCIMPLAAVVTPQSWPGHIYDRLGGLLDQVRHGFDLILMDVGPIGQLSNELSNHALMIDALMIVDENPSSGDFVEAKSRLLKAGVRKFIAAQNSVGAASI